MDQGTNIFSLYNSTLQTWSEAFGLGSGKAQAFSLPFASPTDVSRSAFRNMASSVEICNAWLRGVDCLVGEGFEVSRKLVRGEEAGADGLTENMRNAYDNVTASVMKSLEDTPFEIIKEVDSNVKKNLDSFTEEQKIMKSFLEETLSFGSKTVSLFKSSNGDRADFFTDILKGTSPLVSDTGYKRTAKAYEKILRHFAEAAKPLAVLNPMYKNSVDEMIAWAEKNAGISGAWLETNLEQTRELRRVTMDFFKIVDDTLKQGDSLEEFYEKWVEAMEKARRIYVEDPHTYKIISEFINNNTEFIKSTIELCQESEDLPPSVSEEYMTDPVEESELLEAEAV
ncbi:MAG: hypothetical protein GY795_13075 [Desulfobacterales bacterium]|nr:hypothetical protein [Desulfobacterales bacterium]